MTEYITYIKNNGTYHFIGFISEVSKDEAVESLLEILNEDEKALIAGGDLYIMEVKNVSKVITETIFNFIGFEKDKK